MSLMLHPRRFLLMVILRSKDLHLFNSNKKEQKKIHKREYGKSHALRLSHV